MKFKPLFDKVVIKPDTADEMSQGGIYIPTKAQETPHKGEVVAVGQGSFTDTGEVLPMSVKVGDKVVYGKYAGSEIKIEGEDYVIVEEESIMGVLDEQLGMNWMED